MTELPIALEKNVTHQIYQLDGAIFEVLGLLTFIPFSGFLELVVNNG